MSIVPTDHPFGEAWIAAYFADVDSLDPVALLRWYAEDASFRFAGHPPVRGKSAIAASLAAFFDTVAGMRHDRTGALGRLGNGQRGLGGRGHLHAKGRIASEGTGHERTASGQRFDTRLSVRDGSWAALRRRYASISMKPGHLLPGKEPIR